MENKVVKIVLTILVAALVLYAGGYTFYYVYIVPPHKIQMVSDKNSETNLNVIAAKVVDYVPYVIESKSAYDVNEVKFTNLTADIYQNYALKYIRDNELLETNTSTEYINFLATNCSLESSYNCFSISINKINEILMTMYGKTVVHSNFNINNDVNNTCIINGDYYFCKELITENSMINEKVSKIESIKLDEKNLYVYERTGFLINSTVTLVDNMYDVSISSLSLLPTIGMTIENNITFSSHSNNITDEIYSTYSNRFNLFKHTYSVNEDGTYYWQSTIKVNSTEE